jgi:hypothetical protein
MEFFQNIGIICSINSQRKFYEEAKRKGHIYTFNGASREINWVTRDFAYLALSGAVNSLRRLGLKFDLLTLERITEDTLNNYRVLIIPNAVSLQKEQIEWIIDWCQKDRKFFVTGKTNLPEEFLGISSRKGYQPKGYIGVRWTSRVAFDPFFSHYTLSPPDYAIDIVTTKITSQEIGEVFEFQPETAIEKDVSCPGFVVSDKGVYCPLPIFEFIGGLLQGHLDIEPLTKVLSRESFFFIDRLIYYIYELLKAFCLGQIGEVLLRPWPEGEKVFVLRHDVDYSRERAYFEYELDNNIPASYSLLLDRNMEFWKAVLQQYPLFDIGYHFYTNRENIFAKIFQRGGYVPHKKAIMKKGIFKQLEKAERRMKTNFKTIQRHASFVFYPETVDALDYAFKNKKELLGSCTMFRFTLHRYHTHPSLKREITIQHPFTSVPFWSPFKMYLSALETQKFLRGWDSTHIIEPSPDLTDWIFKNSTWLDNGVYTFGFHPAHARRPTFNKEGNFPWFIYSIRRAQEKNLWFANLEMVYERLNAWEDIKMQIEKDFITFWNSGNRDTPNFVYFDRGKHSVLKALRPGEYCKIKRLD